MVVSIITQHLLSLFGSCSGINVSDSGGAATTYCTGLPVAAASSANIQHILQIVFGILAVIAVLIIVIAAFNITIAGGDSQKVAKQRTTIIYTMVGLAIAVSAEVIVSFVIGRI